MNKTNSYYKNANMTSLSTVFVAACAMIGFSIYLTSHYFNIKYPSGLAPSALCDINSFLNCDTATFSSFSNIAGVPISVFGIVIGTLVLLGFLVQKESYAKTMYFTVLLNAIGCAVLFFYSIIVLKSLCPFCTLYYIASWIVLFMMSKHHSFAAPAIPSLAGFGVLVGAVFLFTNSNIKEKEANIDAIAADLIKQYTTLPNLGSPAFESQFKLNAVKDAKVKIVKFSDFQCPSCKVFSDTLHRLARKYKDQVQIEYFFYPLDPACNADVKSALHAQACKAAYLAYCLPAKFNQVEGDIFANQSSLSTEWIENYAKKENVLECINSEETKAGVIKYISEGPKFKIRSTPSFLLNGVKIEGALPESQVSIIIDHLLKQ